MPVTLTPAMLSALSPNWTLLENVAMNSAVAIAPTPADQSRSAWRSIQRDPAVWLGAGGLGAGFPLLDDATRRGFDLVADTAVEASRWLIRSRRRHNAKEGPFRAPPSYFELLVLLG